MPQLYFWFTDAFGHVSYFTDDMADSPLGVWELLRAAVRDKVLAVCAPKVIYTTLHEYGPRLVDSVPVVEKRAPTDWAGGR